MSAKHEHGPNRDHDHGHGHESDQGLKGIIRYLRLAPRMWKSEVNDAVVELVAPGSDETVVDIGAGMGPAVVRAAASGASVVAVEPTPFMRRVLSTRRAFSRHRKRIVVSDGGAEALPLADASADAIWAVNTMHHWTSLAESATEISRVLRPGGRIALVDENFADPSHPDSETWHDRRSNDDHHGFTMVDARQIGDLMEEAGLINVVAENRKLANRPVIAVVATAPLESS